MNLAFTCDSISGTRVGVHQMEAELCRNDVLIDKARKNDRLGDPTSPKAYSKPVQTIHIAPITVEKKEESLPSSINLFLRLRYTPPLRKSCDVRIP